MAFVLKFRKSLTVSHFWRQARPKSLITNELRVFVKLEQPQETLTY